MAGISSHPRPSAAAGDLPALALLRCVAGHGGAGVSRGELAAEGWSPRSVSVPLHALRSRGYVVYDSISEHWIATPAGRTRVEDSGGTLDVG